MQRFILHKFQNFLFAAAFLSGLISCRKDLSLDQRAENQDLLNKDEAKEWIARNFTDTTGQPKKLSAKEDTAKNKSLDVPWDRYTVTRTTEGSYGLIGLDGQPGQYRYQTGYRKLLITKDHRNSVAAYILEILPDGLYLQRKGKPSRKDFYGRIFFYDQHYQLVKGYLYTNGKVAGEIQPSAQKSKQQKQDIRVDRTPVTEYCSWNEDNYVNAKGELVVYAERNCTYTSNSDGMGNAGSIPPSGDYTGSGGGSGGSSDSAPPVSDLPDENKPKIDPAAYMKCFGTLPDAGSKMTITVYVEEPAPGLPFNLGPNSVGHTAIGLTKTYKGQSITQVVGFYPDASGKDKMHAPSKILDNTDLEYNVSITYSVIASDFSKIAAFISRPPATYDLTEYNCTSFAYNACLAGGIKLPDPIGNMGMGTEGMMPAALGGSIRKVGLAGDTNVKGGTVAKTHGPCN
ncbi:hypothetical protein D0C36_15985 [Mucilaginibacter conchicola]|uniref:Uncharacterized protein n=1 Tax=Mucilaginibacter conchicola TaxID=2303333 RepID=A0A372NUF1_9SPHI|nr:hypothetical protein [Mucilaginibacter conchicola]RFZ92890.1 hypothetical protein D0C36_15985 [Mucilaginibacter conchicola]